MAKRSKTKTASDIVKVFREILDFIEKYSERIVQFTVKQYNKVKNRFYGKTFAIIGPNMAGKTTFFNILCEPNYEVDPMDYTPTQGEKTFPSKVIQYNIPVESDDSVKKIKLKIRKPKDVGGEKEYRDEGDWETVCESANFVFYIFDIYEYKKNEKMKNRVKEDLEWIAENNQLFAPDFKVILFANKIDKISADKDQRNDWISKELPILETQIKSTLDSYKNHFALIAPISMLSKINRANSISKALLKVAEK